MRRGTTRERCGAKEARPTRSKRRRRREPTTKIVIGGTNKTKGG